MIEILIHQLYRALVLTKLDAEKNGFDYGRQSVCQTAIEAYAQWQVDHGDELDRLKVADAGIQLAQMLARIDRKSNDEDALWNLMEEFWDNEAIPRKAIEALVPHAFTDEVLDRINQ